MKVPQFIKNAAKATLLPIQNIFTKIVTWCGHKIQLRQVDQRILRLYKDVKDHLPANKGKEAKTQVKTFQHAFRTMIEKDPSLKKNGHQMFTKALNAAFGDKKGVAIADSFSTILGKTLVNIQMNMEPFNITKEEFQKAQKDAPLLELLDGGTPRETCQRAVQKLDAIIGNVFHELKITREQEKSAIREFITCSDQEVKTARKNMEASIQRDTVIESKINEARQQYQKQLDVLNTSISAAISMPILRNEPDTMIRTLLTCSKEEFEKIKAQLNDITQKVDSRIQAIKAKLEDLNNSSLQIADVVAQTHLEEMKNKLNSELKELANWSQSS